MQEKRQFLVENIVIETLYVAGMMSIFFGEGLLIPIIVLALACMFGIVLWQLKRKHKWFDYKKEYQQNSYKAFGIIMYSMPVFIVLLVLALSFSAEYLASIIMILLLAINFGAKVYQTVIVYKACFHKNTTQTEGIE